MRGGLIFRSVAPLLVALLVGSLSAAFAMGWLLRKEANRELNHRGRLLADTLARDAELPVLAEDRESLEELLRRATADPDVVRAEIDMPGGDTVALDAAEQTHEGELLISSADIVAEYFESSPFEDGPDLGSEIVGRVTIKLSDHRFRQRHRPILRTIAALGFGVFLLGAALARFAVLSYRRSVAPLMEATRALSSGALHSRVRGPIPDADLAQLAGAINDMASDLEAARAELLEEQGRLEERVEERTEALEAAQRSLVQQAKLSAVGQLVAGVAHELNTPLTVLVGYSELLLKGDVDGRLQEQLETMKNAARSSRRIVQNLLSFSRSTPTKRDAVSLNEVVERSIALRKYGLEKHGIAVRLDLASDLPVLWADFHQLQQVVVNLIGNAEHAMHSVDPARRQLEVSTSKVGSGLRLDVADRGVGMEPEVLKRVFDPFFTTKDVGEGTGLGLSICYGIVAEHNGAIEVESEPGQGTRFRVQLEIVEAPSSTFDTGELVARGDMSSLKVLAIDDDDFLLGFIEDVLAPLVSEVQTVRGGLAAMETVAQRQDFDVILCDMRMPEMNGQEFFQHLEEVHPELTGRLVMATGDLANAETRQFLDSSGLHAVAKPFTPSDLVSAVRRLSCRDSAA